MDGFNHTVLVVPIELNNYSLLTLWKNMALGEKVARNKNPTSAGLDYWSCLQLSVQFFLRNKEIAYKIA